MRRVRAPVSAVIRGKNVGWASSRALLEESDHARVLRLVIQPPSTSCPPLPASGRGAGGEGMRERKESYGVCRERMFRK